MSSLNWPTTATFVSARVVHVGDFGDWDLYSRRHFFGPMDSVCTAAVRVGRKDPPCSGDDLTCVEYLEAELSVPSPQAVAFVIVKVSPARIRTQDS